MGHCLSQLPTAPASELDGQGTVSNISLQLRIPTGELSAAQCEELLEEKVAEAHYWFCHSAEEVLQWKNAPLPSHQFSAALHVLASKAQSFFRSLFLQGTSGENVPFSKICSAQQAVAAQCARDFELLRFCNDYKSWWICAHLKRKAVTLRSRSRALKLFSCEAVGPFQARGQADLAELLSLSGELQLQELESQIALDLEILNSQRLQAEERAQLRVEAIFECRPLDETNRAVRTSLLGLIERLPSADGWESDSTEMPSPSIVV